MGIKVIFLDVDGVLNDHSDLMESFNAGGDNDVITPSKVARLNSIIEATGAVCVLSSTWRVVFGFEQTIALMEKRGFTGSFVGMTPDFVTYRCSETRGSECQAWLDQHDEMDIESYLILDDEEDFPGMEHRRIRTCYIAKDSQGGLQDEHIEQAINILNKPLWKDNNED